MIKNIKNVTDWILLEGGALCLWVCDCELLSRAARVALPELHGLLQTLACGLSNAVADDADWVRVPHSPERFEELSDVVGPFAGRLDQLVPGKALGITGTSPRNFGPGTASAGRGGPVMGAPTVAVSASRAVLSGADTGRPVPAGQRRWPCWQRRLHFAQVS